MMNKVNYVFIVTSQSAIIEVQITTLLSAKQLSNKGLLPYLPSTARSLFYYQHMCLFYFAIKAYFYIFCCWFRQPFSLFILTVRMSKVMYAYASLRNMLW